jgi:hypothetical protein
MWLNSFAFYHLIENINSGKYRAHQHQDEYEEVVYNITNRVIGSIDKVKRRTLIAFLRNRAFTDHIYIQTIDSIVDRDDIYDIKEALMHPPGPGM